MELKLQYLQDMPVLKKRVNKAVGTKLLCQVEVRK